MDRAVRFEFSLMRRIPWQEDPDSFGRHIGDVEEDLSDYGQIEEVAATLDLERGRVAIELHLIGPDPDEVEAQARTLMGKAIRSAGAYHRGLLPPHDEIRLRPDVNAWSGLRTPTWQVRTVTNARHRTNSTSHVTGQQAASPAV